MSLPSSPAMISPGVEPSGAGGVTVRVTPSQNTRPSGCNCTPLETDKNEALESTLAEGIIVIVRGVSNASAGMVNVHTQPAALVTLRIAGVPSAAKYTEPDRAASGTNRMLPKNKSGPSVTAKVPLSTPLE